MALKAAFLTATVLCLMFFSCTTLAQTRPDPPAPAPAPRHVNLTDLLSLAGPYRTFLDYLTKTEVIQTFQNQANNTDQGITVFVPEDAAFAALDKSALSGLTGDQLRSLLLYHALPKYYPLSEFTVLSKSNPITTFAGGQYTINVTDDEGIIHVISKWSKAKLVSSVYSTLPVAVYALDKVLLPVQIFSTEPASVPVSAPAPAPERKPSDAAPSTGGHKATDSGESKSLSCRIGANVLISYLVLKVSVFLILA